MGFRRFVMCIAAAVLLVGSIISCEAGDIGVRGFPLRNGDFSYSSRPWGLPANWGTMTWSGRYSFTLDPPPTGPQNQPSAAVITAIDTGRAAYWQDVVLMKGRYRLTFEVMVSGSSNFSLLANDGNAYAETAPGYRKISSDFSADGSTRIHLIVQGPGEVRFRNMECIPLELESASVPVENGLNIGEIVIPKNADLAEDYAVWELQRCIGRLTGSVPGLQGRDKTQPGIKIIVGGKPAGKLAKLGEDSYRIVKQKDSIILQGNTPRGTLYAVYDFLKLQGCAWAFAGDLGEAIPRVSALKLPAGDRYESPDYDVRGYMIPPQRMYPDGGWMMLNLEDEMDWAVRNRMNALWATKVHDFTAHRGYSHLQTNNHSWAQFLVDDHPEWWTRVNGTRTKLHMSGRPNQICVSNQELRDLAVKRALEAFKAEPRLKIYALSPEDEPCWWCECEKCRKLDADRGKGEWKPAADGTPNISMSDRVINFVNEVAARVSKVYPDKLIECYAYGSYRDAPIREKVHPNVLIKYTYWPRPPLNQRILETKASGPVEAVRQLDGWKKAGVKHFGLYDYYNWVFPDATLAEFFQSTDMLKTLHDRWGFRHALGETEAGTWPSMMMYNIRAAALWNVNTSYKTVIKDLCTKFYGPAGDIMNDYYLKLDDVIQKSDKWKNPDWSYLNFSDFTMNDCLSSGEILSRAEALVKDQAPFDSRLEIARYGHDALVYAVAQSSPEPLSSDQKKLARVCFDRARDTMNKYGLGTNGTGAGVMRVFYLPVKIRSNIMDLPLEWVFKIDPNDVGIKENWFTQQSGIWEPIRTDKDWTSQGHKYHGAAWYSLNLTVPDDTRKLMAAHKGSMHLYFGAVDGTADIYLNGTKIGEQKSPAALMWDKSFTIPLPENFDPSAANNLCIRVEKDAYAAGIWKPVSIVVE